MRSADFSLQLICNKRVKFVKKNFLLLELSLFQIIIIAVMLVKAMLPLLTGQEIELQVDFRDPRELFRGNYVALNYRFNRINLDDLPNDIPPDAEYHYGDVLYLALKKNERFYEADGLWQSPPKDGAIFLRGIVSRRVYANQRVISLNYGIESYFTDPEQAKTLETQLRRPAVADSLAMPTVTVMVDKSGGARIKRVNYSLN